MFGWNGAKLNQPQLKFKFYVYTHILGKTCIYVPALLINIHLDIKSLQKRFVVQSNKIIVTNYVAQSSCHLPNIQWQHLTVNYLCIRQEGKITVQYMVHPYFKQQTLVKFKEKLTIVNHQFVKWFVSTWIIPEFPGAFYIAKFVIWWLISYKVT